MNEQQLAQFRTLLIISNIEFDLNLEQKEESERLERFNEQLNETTDSTQSDEPIK